MVTMNEIQPSTTPNPAAKVTGEVVGFAAGFASLFRGARLVYLDHRELARYYLPPMILALFFVAGAWVGFWLTVDDIINWIWPEPDGDAWWGVKHFLWRAAAVMMFVHLVLVGTRG